MQTSSLLMLLVLVASLIGCRDDANEVNAANNEVQARECIQRPRLWSSMDSDHRWGEGINGLDFNHVDVGYDGSLRWGSQALTFERVEQNLRIADSLAPAPPIVLRATPDSNCVMAERVRRVMDSLATCRAGGCYEDEQWVALGYPTYGEYYRSNGERRYE